MGSCFTTCSIAYQWKKDQRLSCRNKGGDYLIFCSARKMTPNTCCSWCAPEGDLKRVIGSLSNDSFHLPGVSHQNSRPSFQIESQLPRSAQNGAAKVNVKLESVSKNNEKKASITGNSGVVRRRWIVVRRVGVALGPICVPKIEHGRRLENGTWDRFRPEQRRVFSQGLRDGSISWTKHKHRADAASSHSESAVHGLHSGTTGPVREKGTRPRRMRNDSRTRRSLTSE